MESTESESHAAVGRAVIACQVLETVFALCVRLQFEQSSAKALNDITPLEKNFSKPPMKVLLTRLKKCMDISADFESRVSDLIERRHKLIHRWGIEEVFPESEEQFRKLTAFATALADEAAAMAMFLLSGLVEWANRFPELAQEHGWNPSLPEHFRSLRVGEGS